MNERIPASQGMLHFILSRLRPELGRRIAETNRIETAVVGLGRQGVKHAGLMREFGTDVVAGIAANFPARRVQETIPVYSSILECLEHHPDLGAVSIWRHHSSAGRAALEVIEAGVPLVVLITEGIPLRDVRDVLALARKHKTLLIGGNTPGLIFPPEGIKLGMLPDVFAAQEIEPGKLGPAGITIISRSGAILYHMSDAMASVGIAQNAVIGVGGDGATGSVFTDLVPLAMTWPHTDLVLIAGEVGGCQEELLALDVLHHPDRYPKPLVAVLSGAQAPAGKTLGHAGAIVAPGMPTGTFKAKKKALTEAGVPVVNSQYGLIETVQSLLGGKTYFRPQDYYRRMRRIWAAPPRKVGWSTAVTSIEPNRLLIRGYRIQDLIRNASWISVAHLLVTGELPDSATEQALAEMATRAAEREVPEELIPQTGMELSRAFALFLLGDDILSSFGRVGEAGEVEKTVFAMGRALAYQARLSGRGRSWLSAQRRDFGTTIGRAITGQDEVDAGTTRLLEAMIVASVDHGVTPPSAQATLIASSVRAGYESALAQGVGAITDVHGGAGEKAALFFEQCVRWASREGLSIEAATREVMTDFVEREKRIEGMGHRIHSQDPRCETLRDMAESAEKAGACVAISRIATEVLETVRGIRLPVNVDGVIGAIVADMNLDPKLAKSLFILGRVTGLSAHYFEEIATQPSMRRINFADAVYSGPPPRPYPACRIQSWGARPLVTSMGGE